MLSGHAWTRVKRIGIQSRSREFELLTLMLSGVALRLLDRHMASGCHLALK